jgi:spermidine synthase
MVWYISSQSKSGSYRFNTQNMAHHFQNFNIETAYNSIDVRRSGERLEFRSGDNALQSVIDLRNPHHLELRNLEYLMAVLLFIPEPERILMLGTAAGSLLHFLKHHYPKSLVTAVDIDAELIEQLLQREILPSAGDGLNYVYADAAQFIQQDEQSYDLILIDIFTGSQSPPWLLEKESVNCLARLLGEPGGLAYNLIIDSDHDFKRFYRNLRLVFEERTLCLPVRDLANTIAYGINTRETAPEMTAHMQNALGLSERLGIDLMRILSVIYSTNPVNGGLI